MESQLKIYVMVKTTYTGSKVEDCIEVQDDATDLDIEEIVKEWMFDNIEWTWSKIDAPTE